jgi:dTDP-4-dehydrorhamnose reductase
MPRVLVLGASGMLGSMLVDCFSRAPGFQVTGSLRGTALAERFRTAYPAVRWTELDYGSGDALAAALAGQDWIVNAIGITKPLVHDDDAAEVHRAIRVNALLPHELALHALAAGAKVLQIATDCVYSGARGAYLEGDAHDALDVYGKTKSLGETRRANMHHLRCSIIGPEPKDYKFLIEWFRRQPPAAQVNGFTNHRWNGITTLHFARLCRGVIAAGLDLPHLQHVVPAGFATKAQMLHEFAAAYRRPDVRIADVPARTVIDRTLATGDGRLNRALWEAAGYAQPPTVAEMIHEVAEHPFAAGPEAVERQAPA